MNLTQETKQPDWPKLIKAHRFSLELNQEEYGRLYNVTKQAVSLWELGSNEAPYQVTWEVLKALESKEAEDE